MVIVNVNFYVADRQTNKPFKNKSLLSPQFQVHEIETTKKFVSYLFYLYNYTYS